MIKAVSEGKGKVSALPTLLRRLTYDLGVYDIPVDGKALFCPKNKMVADETEFKRYLHLCKSVPGATAALFLFDADDDCARDCVPQMRRWAQVFAPDFPCAIVMARRKYEAWFLAALPSLREKYGMAADAVYIGDPERKRGAKEALREFVPGYKPSTHQASLSAEVNLAEAFRGAGSFQKLTRELCRLLEALGRTPIVPETWLASDT